jgi:hypothetical protein
MKKCVLGVFLSQVLFISVSAQLNLTKDREQYLHNLYDLSMVFDTTRVVLKESHTPLFDTLNGWKEWQIVNNYSFGKNRGSLPMITDLQSLHPYFRDQILELIRICKASGITLAVVESYRTHAKQAEYYGMGAKYTSTAGGKSKHQYGLAVDVVPMVDSVAVWDNAKLWRKIGVAGERLGLRWGGRWRVLYDPGHFEWSGISIYQLAKGYLPRIPHTKWAVYPCIEEDIQRLKKYWEAWEVEQSVIAKNGSPLSSSLLSVEQQ